MGEEARGYSWQPFEPGHTLSTKHGAHSERRWRPIAEVLEAEITAAAPWVGTPAYAGTLAAWARIEAQLRLVSDWLDEHGLLDGAGKPRPATNLADRLEARAARLRHALGLSPMAVASLIRTLTRGDPDLPLPDALETLRAEGRRALLAAATDAPELKAGP